MPLCLATTWLQSMSSLPVSLSPCTHIVYRLRVWVRIPVSNDNLQRITVKANTQTTTTTVKDSMDTSQEGVHDEPASGGRRSVVLNIIHPLTFKSISSVPHIGSYGSKINTLIKHLLFIEREEPGAKSIVFSAWADSLKSESNRLGLRLIANFVQSSSTLLSQTASRHSAWIRGNRRRTQRASSAPTPIFKFFYFMGKRIDFCSDSFSLWPVNAKMRV